MHVARNFQKGEGGGFRYNHIQLLQLQFKQNVGFNSANLFSNVLREGCVKRTPRIPLATAWEDSLDSKNVPQL